MRSVLLQYPKADPNVARVRFVGFGESSLDVEIYCHLLTTDWNKFLALREKLLLRIMEEIADAGAEFAFPSRTLYIAHDHGQDPQLMRSLERHASASGNHS